MDLVRVRHARVWHRWMNKGSSPVISMICSNHFHLTLRFSVLIKMSKFVAHFESGTWSDLAEQVRRFAVEACGGKSRKV